MRIASLALPLLAASTAAVAQESVISLDTRTIHAGDLAQIPGYSDIELGKVPAGLKTAVIDIATAKRLIENRLPGIPFQLRFEGEITLSVPIPKSHGGTACYRARHDLAPGDILSGDAVVRTECGPEKITRALGYDRERRVPFAHDTIATGEFLGAVRPAMTDVLAHGQRLTFVTGEGEVVVQRQVEALQAGRPGRRLFVRTEDGEVIAARLAPSTVNPETER